MVTRIRSAKPPKLYLMEWRELRGLNQEQLASRVDTTKTSISRWETGERDITAKALAALADALSIENTGDLFRPPPPPKPDPDPDSLDTLLANHSDKLRKTARKLIQSLIEDEEGDGTNG